MSKRYRNVEALRDVNLSIERKHIYGLIGPNGAGKTTLMKVILAYVQYKGRVEFDGKTDRTGISINYIPEVINFYDYLTGEQAVKLITYLQGRDMKQMLAAFYSYAKRLDYRDHDKLIREHSKGNLRKLMLLQSMAVANDIMLLDEPFSGLDPMTVDKVIDCLLSIKAETGCTILINTHLFDAAKKLCDDLYFIKGGRIIGEARRPEYESISLAEMFDNDNG
ncbi:MAG: ABC transporter ATP-binding protein [Rikenellaceae bacterium]|nr:ABC transporter ATP-binding protein [Rikenellaceae bacterium]MCL2692897.1 ABC transporter ATP-binding protein [Rikenellaceae bacterium]